MKIIHAFLILLLLATAVFDQANGKLQIHFIDIGHGECQQHV